MAQKSCLDAGNTGPLGPGENEAVILDYLTKNYAPQQPTDGRRAPLENIEWYELKD